MDFASQREEQTGAVFNLVARPFVLFLRVRRHAYTKQAGLCAEAGTVAHKESGRGLDWHWVGLLARIWNLFQVLGNCVIL